MNQAVCVESAKGTSADMGTSPVPEIHRIGESLYRGSGSSDRKHGGGSRGVEAESEISILFNI